MDRARLDSGWFVGPIVDQPGLVVSSRTDRRAKLREPALDATIKLCGNVLGRFAGHQRATGAEIDRRHLGRAKISADQGSELGRVLRQPGHHALSVGHRRHPTSFSKGVVRETGMDCCEERQGPGKRLLADPEVVVPWRVPGLLGRDARAHAQSHAHQAEERLELGLGQGVGLVMARNDRCRRGQRIGGAQGNIGTSDRDIVDDVAVHHVAKIDDSCDRLVLLVDEDVVVVKVAMDDAAPEPREERDDVGPMVRCERSDPVGERRVGDQGDETLDDVLRVREVPIEIAMEAGMIKGRECAAQTADRATEVAPHGVGRETRDAESGTRQCRDESNELGTVRADLVAQDGRDQPGSESAWLQMEHHRTFRLEHLTPFGDIGQLEDEALPGLGLEEDVLVPFGRKVGCLGSNVVEPLGEGTRVG